MMAFICSLKLKQHRRNDQMTIGGIMKEALKNKTYSLRGGDIRVVRPQFPFNTMMIDYDVESNFINSLFVENNPTSNGEIINNTKKNHLE